MKYCNTWDLIVMLIKISNSMSLFAVYLYRNVTDIK